MKKLLFLLICTIAGMTAQARKVTEQEALQKAQQFFNKTINSQTSKRSAPLQAAKLTLASNRDEYYVFNDEVNGGYVVISGDERMPDILGYSTKGNYQAGKNPPALEWWLGQMQHELRSVRQGANVQQIPNHPAIQPMIQTHWGQDEPYNLRLPNRGCELTQHYYTGCVATAMAQVMYYYRCPEGQTTTIPDYLDQSFTPTSFNWDVMQPSYWDSRGEGIDEVCKLMFYCCASVEAKLSFEETGASHIDMTEALRRYFGFAETTHSVQRTSFSAEEWDQLIYHELEEGRVVLYSGSSVSTDAYSAHMFICDGYDENGLYHINWGWDGGSDGYFLLSVLNPDEEGVGGNQGSGGYSIGQMATIGIKKAETPLPLMTRADLGTIVVEEGKNGVLDRSSDNEDFPAITVSPTLYNSVVPDVKRSYDAAIGLYRDAERIAIMEGDNQSNRKDIEMESHSGRTMTVSNIRFGKGLSDGDYLLKVLCRESGMDEWQETIGADDNKVKVNVSGNKMTWTVYNSSYEESSEVRVNSAVVEGNLKMGEPLTIKVNVTNEGTHNDMALYLWCNSDPSDLSHYHLVAGLGTGLDAGTTGDLTMTYTPWRSGNHKFFLSNHPENEGGEHLYEIETDIAQSEPVVAMRLLYVEKKECEYEYNWNWGYAPVMRMYPQYTKTGTFTCNFGLAIRKDNQLVRRDGFWGGWTFVDWKVCTAYESGGMFDGLEDGDYQVSMDYSVGDGEWIPCIGSDTTFVEMKIDHGKAYFKNRFLNGEGFTVDAMSIEGKPRIKQKMNVNVTATNNTPYTHHCVFLHVNDSVVGIRMFENMKTGTTETMPFTREWWDSTYDFVASTTGPHTFSVVDGDGNVVHSQTLDITSAPLVKLTPVSHRFVSSPDNEVYVLPYPKLYFKLRNDSEYIYDDNLKVKLRGVWSVLGNDTTFINFQSDRDIFPALINPYEEKEFVYELGWTPSADELSVIQANIFYYSSDDELLVLQTPFYPTIWDYPNGIITTKGDEKLFNIYDVQGRLVRRNVNSLNGLPNGMYIVNGRKIVK